MTTRVEAAAIGTLALGVATLLAVACSSSASPPPTWQEARSSLPYDANPQVSDADYQSLIASNSDFAFALYDRLGAGNGDNLVLSPLSASVALAMAYAGAKGDTATGMAHALHFDLPAERLHPAFDRLMLDLASRNVAVHSTERGDKSVRLDILDAIWSQQGVGFVPAYLDTLSASYDAGVELVDFSHDPGGSRDAINRWASDATQGRIADLLGPADITRDTRVVLTNALYFHASWERSFDAEQTTTAMFHTLAAGDVAVPMMHATQVFAYAEGDGYQVVDLPYDGAKLSLRVVLPADGRFAGIESALSASFMASVDQAMPSHQGDVAVSLPKFTLAPDTVSFKKALEDLGMSAAFQPGADFTGMVPEPGLFIDNVLQKARIGVDESGTEAAAATAVTFRDASAPNQFSAFTVDRPFIFMIRDTTGTILFVGRVTDPSS